MKRNGLKKDRDIGVLIMNRHRRGAVHTPRLIIQRVLFLSSFEMRLTGEGPLGGREANNGGRDGAKR